MINTSIKHWPNE